MPASGFGGACHTSLLRQSQCMLSTSNLFVAVDLCLYVCMSLRESSIHPILDGSSHCERLVVVARTPFYHARCCDTICGPSGAFAEGSSVSLVRWDGRTFGGVLGLWDGRTR